MPPPGRRQGRVRGSAVARRSDGSPHTRPGSTLISDARVSSATGGNRCPCSWGSGPCRPRNAVGSGSSHRGRSATDVIQVDGDGRNLPLLQNIRGLHWCPGTRVKGSTLDPVLVESRPGVGGPRPPPSSPSLRNKGFLTSPPRGRGCPRTGSDADIEVPRDNQ